MDMKQTSGWAVREDGKMMTSMAAGGSGDPHTQMNTYRSYVTMLADPGAKDEIKLKAAQELSENFEVTI